MHHVSSNLQQRRRRPEVHPVRKTNSMARGPHQSLSRPQHQTLIQGKVVTRYNNNFNHYHSFHSFLYQSDIPWLLSMILYTHLLPVTTECTSECHHVRILFRVDFIYSYIDTVGSYTWSLIFWNKVKHSVFGQMQCIYWLPCFSSIFVEEKLLVDNHSSTESQTDSFVQRLAVHWVLTYMDIEITSQKWPQLLEHIMLERLNGIYIKCVTTYTHVTLTFVVMKCLERFTLSFQSQTLFWTLYSCLQSQPLRGRCC